MYVKPGQGQLVDPDAVLAFAIAPKSLELIRAWNRKILQISGGVQLLQLSASEPRCIFLRKHVGSRLRDLLALGFPDGTLDVPPTMPSPPPVTPRA